MTVKLNPALSQRFRKFLPVVVDVETGGIIPTQHALLEMCIVLIDIDTTGSFVKYQTFFEHILPFEGSMLDPKALELNKIDPTQPLRFALDEKEALKKLFTPIKQAIQSAQCQRAVLVGHNAWFDLLFIKAAAERNKLKHPFHAFTCFDTATLSGLFYGQTVLSRALHAAGIPFDKKEAHSAIYDAEKTADLFCKMLNQHDALQQSRSCITSV